MKIALLQMTSGIDPVANAETLEAAVAEAGALGATMLFTPEMSGLVDSDGDRAAHHIVGENDDQVLARVRAAAKRTAIWIHIGSLAVARGQAGDRWANRSFVIDATGEIVGRYDKMHLFDVDLPTGERWRESTRYAAGAQPCVVDTPLGALGLSICYDMRFPALFQTLSSGGATLLAIPAAFTVPTGQAHWHTLLRARAIENACWVIAAAQVGVHADGRETYGHSLVVDPWGRVVLDMAERTGVAICDVEMEAVADVRSRVPVLAHRRAIPALHG